jgi:hypothetical protein
MGTSQTSPGKPNHRGLDLEKTSRLRSRQNFFLDIPFDRTHWTVAHKLVWPAISRARRKCEALLVHSQGAWHTRLPAVDSVTFDISESERCRLSQGLGHRPKRTERLTRFHEQFAVRVFRAQTSPRLPLPSSRQQ